ncbi:MAG: DOMON-like domain-containing protein [Cyanobacteriota bacterium]
MSAPQGPVAPSEERGFALHPFEGSASDLGLQLVGQLARQGDHLRVSYQLSGNLDSVVLPPPAVEGPRRCDGLWEHTCVELFLAAEGGQPYWEVNLAPSGHWNLYRLEGYRQGLAPEPDRQELPFTVSHGAGGLEVALELALPTELAQACRQHPLRLGVTAVTEQRGGDLSYWALAHSGPEADFHRREDFLLRLEP